MPQETISQTSRTASTADAAILPEGAFIAACLVLPVIWGVIVHQVFRRLRKEPDDVHSEPDSSVWPDYQI